MRKRSIIAVLALVTVMVLASCSGSSPAPNIPTWLADSTYSGTVSMTVEASVNGVPNGSVTQNIPASIRVKNDDIYTLSSAQGIIANCRASGYSYRITSNDTLYMIEIPNVKETDPTTGTVLTGKMTMKITKLSDSSIKYEENTQGTYQGQDYKISMTVSGTLTK